MTDKLSEYGYGFQVKVLAAMFTDRLFLQQIADIIQSDYFESDANSWLLDVILTHFREYKCPPSKDVLKVKVTEVDNDILKTAILEQLKEVFRFMESDDLTFVKDEILKFCKNQEIKRAIMDSVNLLKMGNYDEIKSKIDGAMKAGADTNIGLEYKANISARYAEAIAPRTEVNYIPEKTSFLVNSIFSAGAINIDDEGIVKITARES